MASTTTADQKIRLGLAVVITIAWAVSFTADILVVTYDPPASIHPLMMIVAGAVFGEGLVRSAIQQRNGNSSAPEGK